MTALAPLILCRDHVVSTVSVPDDDRVTSYRVDRDLRAELGAAPTGVTVGYEAGWRRRLLRSTRTVRFELYTGDELRFVGRLRARAGELHEVAALPLTDFGVAQWCDRVVYPGWPTLTGVAVSADAPIPYSVTDAPVPDEVRDEVSSGD